MGGYGKVISHVIIGLKTVKGLKQLKLDPTIYDSLQKERVQASALLLFQRLCMPCLASCVAGCSRWTAHRPLVHHQPCMAVHIVVCKLA